MITTGTWGKGKKRGVVDKKKRGELDNYETMRKPSRLGFERRKTPSKDCGTKGKLM